METTDAGHPNWMRRLADAVLLALPLARPATPPVKCATADIQRFLSTRGFQLENYLPEFAAALRDLEVTGHIVRTRIEEGLNLLSGWRYHLTEKGAVRRLELLKNERRHIVVLPHPSELHHD